MEREQIQDFTRRVTQASRTELVVITYDILLEDIRTAKEAFEKNELERYEKDLKHVVRFINELMAALDLSIPISRDLLSLYSFINKTVIYAWFHKSPDKLDSVSSVIRKLRSAFAEISKQDKSGPVMKNTQQLYAGLTYGKGTLNEAYIDPNEGKRGFLA